MSLPPQQPGQPPADPNQPPGGAPQNGPIQNGPIQNGPFPDGTQPPGQQPPKESTGKRIGKRALSMIIGLVVIVVGLGAIGLVSKWWQQRGMDNQVGSCVNVTGSGNDVSTEEVDCSTTTFHYYVAAAVDSASECPQGDYTTITTTQEGRVGSSTIGAVCLMPKMAADTCYAENSPGNELRDVECTDTNAIFRVSKVLDQVAPDQCENPDQSLTYADPVKTYCLVAPNA